MYFCDNLSSDPVFIHEEVILAPHLCFTLAAQTRTSTDRGTEPSFPGGQSELAFSGRPGPAQTEWQSPLSQADRDQRRPSGRALSQNGVSHPLGPFRGTAGGMGGLGRALLAEGQSPLSQEGRQSRLSRNQWSQTHGHKGRPGPAQTEGQSNLSQEGRRTRQTRTSTDRGAEQSFPGRQADQADQDQHRPRGRALFPRKAGRPGPARPGKPTLPVCLLLSITQTKQLLIVALPLGLCTPLFHPPPLAFQSCQSHKSKRGPPELLLEFRLVQELWERGHCRLPLGLCWSTSHHNCHPCRLHRGALH